MNANTSHDENAVACNVDSTIDRALSALRDAQPRSGLEGRILASLEQRTHAPGGLPFHNVKGWGIARGTARGLALWTAASAAVLAIASLAVLHHHSQQNIGVAHPLANAKGWDAGTAAVLTNSAHRAQAEQPQVATESTPRMAHPSAFLKARGHDAGNPIHDDGAVVVMGGAATTPTDAQLLADLHAPSHPAPPLPLTPQEKLFLRMLRYGNATQIAELNPLMRARQEADETAAFKAFFPDPPPLQQPNGDTE